MHFVRIGSHMVNLAAIAFIRFSEAAEGGRWISAEVYFAGVETPAGAPLTIEFTNDDAARLQAILSRMG